MPYFISFIVFNKCTSSIHVISAYTNNLQVVCYLQTLYNSIMPQENEAVHVELYFSSQEVKQHLLDFFPLKILYVQSIDKDGRCLHLEL